MAEVIVIGGGIVGCAIADRLARAGVEVCLLEREVLGGAATAASMGHLVVLDDDPVELALCAWSCARWAELASELPRSADYTTSGTLWLARDAEEMQEAAAKQQRLAAAGINSELLTAAQLALSEPAVVSGLAGGLRVPNDALVYPPIATLHLARRASAAGADIRCGVTVSRIEGDCVVLADGRRLRAPSIVLATGCSAPELLPGLPIRPRKGHLLITTRGAPLIRHQLVELGYVKSAHSASGDSVAFNAQPRPGGQLLLGSTRQFDDQSTVTRPHLLAALLARGREFLPGLDGLNALRAWTGFRPATPDNRPLIGPWPGNPALWLACGHEGLGVTTALGTAELLAALLLHLPLPFAAAPFAPARFASLMLEQAA